MTLDDLNFRYRRLLPNGMHWECGNGWAPIIDVYLAIVDYHVPRGRGYQLRQVKEKMGGLRIYDSADVVDEVRAVLDEARELAECRSYYACEVCGRRGSLRGRNWFRVRCDEHTRDEITGEIEPPRDPGPDIRIGSAGGAGWKRYDPGIDAFVECEAPEPMR